MGRCAAVVLLGRGGMVVGVFAIACSACSRRPLALPDPADLSVSDLGLPAPDLASAHDTVLPDLASKPKPDLAHLDIGSPDLAANPDLSCNAEWVDCDSDSANGCECRATACAGGVCRKRVFVTSKTYNAALGGLIGADQKCQALADGANLGGTYRAWLCDDTGSPSTRFAHSGVPYIRVDGTVVAKDWTSLTSGTFFTGDTIAAPIDKTETGGAAPTQPAGFMWPVVWTNCDGNGTQLPYPAIANCNEWTSATDRFLGTWGNAESSNIGWTYNWETGCDNGFAALYCFEQ